MTRRVDLVRALIGLQERAGRAWDAVEAGRSDDYGTALAQSDGHDAGNLWKLAIGAAARGDLGGAVSAVGQARRLMENSKGDDGAEMEALSILGNAQSAVDLGDFGSDPKPGERMPEV